MPRPLSEARSRDLAKNFDRNYVHSLDWRWLTNPLNDGPGESWIRPTTSLVNGETMTPLERLFAVADCANGIGSKIDITKWTFLNNDLVVHVHRIPDGEWVGSAPRPATARTASGPRWARCSTKPGPWAAFSSRCWYGDDPADRESAASNAFPEIGRR